MIHFQKKNIGMYDHPLHGLMKICSPELKKNFLSSPICLIVYLVIIRFSYTTLKSITPKTPKEVHFN